MEKFKGKLSYLIINGDFIDVLLQRRIRSRPCLDEHFTVVGSVVTYS